VPGEITVAEVAAMADPVEHLIPLFGKRGGPGLTRVSRNDEIPCGHHSLNEDAITDRIPSAVERIRA